MALSPAPSDADVLLIVPGGVGDGPAQRAQAEASGVVAVGASSVRDDPAAAQYQIWAFLPHIATPEFEPELVGLIERLGVRRIHATHYLVWARIKSVLETLPRPVILTRGRTFMELEGEYGGLRERVRAYRPPVELAAAPPLHASLTVPEAAGFLRAALSIPGESHEPKLMAMIEVARHVPSGDVVEIGSLFGRTAVLLALLARRHELGRVLCIDPWSKDELDQGVDALRRPSLDYDWDAWRRISKSMSRPLPRTG